MGQKPTLGQRLVFDRLQDRRWERTDTKPQNRRTNYRWEVKHYISTSIEGRHNKFAIILLNSGGNVLNIHSIFNLLHYTNEINGGLKGFGCVHICVKLGQHNLLRMVRWMRWHCPLDTGFEIRSLAVWGRACSLRLSVTEAPQSILFL